MYIRTNKETKYLNKDFLDNYWCIYGRYLELRTHEMSYKACIMSLCFCKVCVHFCGLNNALENKNNMDVFNQKKIDIVPDRVGYCKT